MSDRSLPPPPVGLGSVLLRQAEELAAKYPNTIPIMLDVDSQEGRLDSLVKDHDLVIRSEQFRAAWLMLTGYQWVNYNLEKGFNVLGFFLTFGFILFNFVLKVYPFFFFKKTCCSWLHPLKEAEP